MKSQWIAMEHYRLHSVEQWPDGPAKEAALAAIHSSLESLARISGGSTPPCSVCQSQLHETGVLQFPGRRAA
jgi:hypothetical protein